jgi:hypothetical protein
MRPSFSWQRFSREISKTVFTKLQFALTIE